MNLPDTLNVPAPIFKAVFDYLGTRPSQETEGLRAHMLQLVMQQQPMGEATAAPKRRKAHKGESA